MSVVEVTFYKVECTRAGCDRDSAAQGFTAAFPTREAAEADWVMFGGSVDPLTGITLCNFCQPMPCHTCGEAPAVTTDREGDPACGDCARVAVA